MYCMQDHFYRRESEWISFKSIIVFIENIRAEANNVWSWQNLSQKKKKGKWTKIKIKFY